MHIDDLLRIAMERKASDLHLKVGNYPHVRIDGELVPLTDQPRISAEDMLNMAFSMMSNRQKQKFKEVAELDMAYGGAGLGRFREPYRARPLFCTFVFAGWTKVQRSGRARYGLRRRRPWSIPCKRLSTAWQRRTGTARDPNQDSRA